MANQKDADKAIMVSKYHPDICLEDITKVYKKPVSTTGD
jgi:hypothetical protein